ncbi:MAG: hypothetical protein AB7O26_18225, partial [Planctomycetaceae bacterium]
YFPLFIAAPQTTLASASTATALPAASSTTESVTTTDGNSKRESSRTELDTDEFESSAAPAANVDDYFTSFSQSSSLNMLSLELNRS